MDYNSCFDIIGPVMVGPSSSHTAGVVSIGRFVHEFLGGQPHGAKIVFYESFAQTYRGHGTDKAIIGGLLGMHSEDLNIRNALEIVKERGLKIEFELEKKCPFYDHPNTVLVQAEREKTSCVIGGASVGGGLSKIVMIEDIKMDLYLNTPYDMERIKGEILQRKSQGHFSME